MTRVISPWYDLRSLLMMKIMLLFFLAYVDLRERFDASFPACIYFLRSVCMHHFHFFGQDQPTVAQWAEMTVDKCCLTSCIWTRFPDRFPHYAWTAYSAHSFGSRVYACSGVTCLPFALLAERSGSFMCYCGNMEWNRHQIRVGTES